MTALHRPSPHHIGPNAITQVLGAVRQRCGTTACSAVLDAAGLAPYRLHPPAQMVHEDEVAALQRAVRRVLPAAEAHAVLRLAGERTADYLLAHRIPRAAQTTLRMLPPGIAARILLRAVTAHAWTFAGSGTFRAVAGHPVIVEVSGCPLCRGLAQPDQACITYAAVFERLFQKLVHRDARAVEIACEAAGAPACRFALFWRPVDAAQGSRLAFGVGGAMDRGLQDIPGTRA